MASDDPTGKPARFGFGPRAIGALIPTVTRPAFRSHAAPAAQLMADWPGIVGPALAAVSFPRALSRGTLTLACSGPIALELQHLTGPLAERINAHFGRTLVQQFRFVQTIGPAVTRPAAVPRRDSRHGARRTARRIGRTGRRRGGRTRPCAASRLTRPRGLEP